MGKTAPSRILVFVATGYLGEELIAQIDGDRLGRAANSSAWLHLTSEFQEIEFRVVVRRRPSGIPRISTASDLFINCVRQPEAVALEMARAALRAGGGAVRRLLGRASHKPT